MKEQSYITFSLNNILYGISNGYIEEVFPIPELTVIPTAPRELVGVVNLRGEMLPILDLHLSLGQRSLDYNLTDTIVVLKLEYARVGIIVNEVRQVIKISPAEITTELSHHRDLEMGEGKTIIADLLVRAGDILILNNPETWLRSVEIEQIISKIQNISTEERFQLLNGEPIFFPNATPEARIILRERADNLKGSVDSQELKNFKPLAVIVLDGNFFGIDLAIVREFTDLSKVTPLPCCPQHIIGNMNLRGEILTLVDLRRLLNLPLKMMPDSCKIMIVEIEDIVAGVIVEEVTEAMLLLPPSEIKVTQKEIHSINHEYLEGSASYQEKSIGILDLPKIFLSGGLIVEEFV